MEWTPYQLCKPLHTVSFPSRLILHRSSSSLYYHHSDVLLLLQPFISGSRLGSSAHIFHHRLFSLPTWVIPRTIWPSNVFCCSTAGCVCCVSVTRSRLLTVFKCTLNHILYRIVQCMAQLCLQLYTVMQNSDECNYVPRPTWNGEVNVPSSNSTVFLSTQLSDQLDFSITLLNSVHSD